METTQSEASSENGDTGDITPELQSLVHSSAPGTMDSTDGELSKVDFFEDEEEDNHEVEQPEGDSSMASDQSGTDLMQTIGFSDSLPAPMEPTTIVGKESISNKDERIEEVIILSYRLSTLYFN